MAKWGAFHAGLRGLPIASTRRLRLAATGPHRARMIDQAVPISKSS